MALETNLNLKILNNLPKRKPMRLKNYDYNTQGAYFITICTQNRKEILSNIVVGTPVPTNVNSVVSRFVSTFKRFCNKEYTKNIWQPRFYDHVIRGEQDYKEIWQYIENNPAKWKMTNFIQNKKTPRIFPRG